MDTDNAEIRMQNAEIRNNNAESVENSGELANEILTNHNISVNSASQILTRFYLLWYII